MKKCIMYLSVYLARGGVCARRKAIELIKSGEVRVNGAIETNPAYQVQHGDKVLCHERRVTLPNFFYVLLNKPKGVVTTCEDERKRQTVVDMVRLKDKKIRLYPVGRLDKDTTGALILTNDGNFSQRLAHPKYRVQKTYVATLDKPMSHEDFNRLKDGFFLPDGKFRPDRAYYPRKNNYRVVGLSIHSGKYRIIRRAFYRLGYEVKALDRIYYGNLSLKKLPRGMWRELTKEEVTKLLA